MDKLTKRAIAKARASARLLHGDRPQGYLLRHPLSSEVVGRMDYGDRLSQTFGVFGDIVAPARIIRGKWCASANSPVYNSSNADGADKPQACSEVWAVRLRDFSPVRCELLV